MSICESRIQRASLAAAIEALPQGGIIGLAIIPRGGRLIEPPRWIGDTLVTVYEEPDEAPTTISFSVGYMQPGSAA